MQTGTQAIPAALPLDSHQPVCSELEHWDMHVGRTFWSRLLISLGSVSGWLA